MKKIAIIGASYLQLPLVLKAKEMGLHTLCFAWADGAVCDKICNEFYAISITEKEKILAICKEKHIDGILTIASDVAVPTVNYVAEKLNLIGNTILSGELSTNKFSMRKAFKKANLRIPKFIEITFDSSLDLIKGLTYPLIVKPVDRSGSKGITVLRTSLGLEDAVNYAMEASFINRVIVEEFIDGKEISVESVSFSGQHKIIAFTDKVTTGFPHFVELEHHQPSVFIGSELEIAIKKVVVEGLNCLKVKNGASHSELIITNDHQIYLTEIGARMGGDFIGSDLVKLSTGYDFLKAVVEIALGQFDEPVISENNFSGVYFYTEATKHIKEVHLQFEKEIYRFEFGELKARKVKQSSDRSGYVIYKASAKLIF